MLRVRVLGSLTVERDGAEVALPAGARVRGLLAWLALHPGPRPRAVVAARLWPDVLDASARASLRTAVWELRKALGDADGAILRTTREDVELAAGWVDLQAFTAAVEPDEALALVRGELLAGLEEEWVLAARDEQRERTMAALAASAEAAEARGDLAAAIAADRRRTQLDPFAEAAHRDLIRRLAATGDRPGALRAYAALRDRMRRELGLSPAADTRAAVEAVREDDAGAAAPPSPPRRALLPLAGRRDELAELLAALDRAEAGTGGAIVLTGEGGIGKTRLATELLRRAEDRGARTATCAALELGGATPFGLWAELAGDLARGLAPGQLPPARATWPEDVARLSPAVAERLIAGDAPRAPAGAPDFERARLFEGVCELLAWTAADRTLVVLMEDVHLADTASLELAAYAGRRLPELPVLLVLTRRGQPERPAADQLVHALAGRGALLADVALGPLRPDDLARLVRTVAPLDGAAVERLVAASDGNALLAVETARAAHAGGAPGGLRALVAAATARLDPPARDVAELVAVAGRELSRDEVAELDAGDVTRALESDLLDAHGGRLGFRHQLLRAAAYDALPEHRRAALHGRAAALLRAPAAERGRHLRLAGRDAEAAAELERAGLEARRMGALAESAAFLAEALELRPGDAGLLLELGDVAAWRGEWDAADAAFERTLAALEPADAVGRARAHARRGLWLRSSLCAPVRSAAAYEAALALLDGDPGAPRDVLLDALAGLAWAEGAGRDPARADALLERLAAEADGAPLPDPVAATALSARGMALARRGRFAECSAPLLAAAAAHARAGMPDEASVSLVNAACAAAAEHDFDRALEYAARAGEQGAGAVRLATDALAARAYVLTRLGRHADAVATAAAALAEAERAGGPELAAMAEHDLGMACLGAGRYGEAAERLGRALDGNARVPRAQARIARAEALARAGRAGEAESEVRAATLEPVGPGDLPLTLVPRMTRVQGLIAAARGDRELAAARLEEAAAGWRARLGASGGAGFVVDLGRPPVAGLVEPGRELARVEAELAALAGDSITPA